MKTLLALLCLLPLMAQAEIQIIDVFANDVELAHAATQIKLSHLRYLKVPSKIKVVEHGHCSSEDIGPCESRTVLERTPVVQVVVSYDDGSPFEDSSMQLEINLPVDAFLPEDLKTIQHHSAFNFDLLGRHSRALNRVMKRTIALTVTKSERMMDLVDYQRSQMCGENDRPSCRDRIVTRPGLVKFKTVNVSLK